MPFAERGRPRPQQRTISKELPFFRKRLLLAKWLRVTDPRKVSALKNFAFVWRPLGLRIFAAQYELQDLTTRCLTVPLPHPGH